MTSGFITGFAMLAFIAIVVWVFVIKKKEDFKEQSELPLDEEARRETNSDGRTTREDRS